MDEKQMTKGREAYRMMDESCNQLVQSGNWQRVGSSDIKLFLDMYVQALLLKMAQTTGEISGDMLTYIARVPARDILKIGQAAPQQALNIGFKNRSFAEGTPLLLRCCVAMDDKDGTATAQQFVDGVSRLLYAAADVDGDMSRIDRHLFCTSLYHHVYAKSGAHMTARRKPFGASIFPAGSRAAARQKPPRKAKSRKKRRRRRKKRWTS